MDGPAILVRTLSKTTREDRYGNPWQYHSRSDHHSKVACWGILFDLLQASSLLRTHVSEKKVWFGINHEMNDFVHNRKKDLDLVLCTSPEAHARAADDFVSIGCGWGVDLSVEQEAKLSALPDLRRGSVSSVLMALEAKACMTAHQRALPRLYDELNSSQATVHGASESAIAAGFVMINHAARYLSPDLNKKNRPNEPEWSVHNQPRDVQLAIDKVCQLPKRSKVGDSGYDALSIVVVDCMNDGSPITLVDGPPSPKAGDIFHYGSMIGRLAQIYATRFKEL